MHGEVIQSLWIEPVDGAFGRNDASLNLRFVLMPRLPSATGLRPISHAILIFDPVDEVADL